MSNFVFFLDIDGVLNSMKHFDFRGTVEGRKRRAGFRERYEESVAIELNMLDSKCVERLQGLISRTGAKIVISSTWRENTAPGHFEFLFRELGFPLPVGTVIGCTPVLDHIEEHKRGHEIATWMVDKDYFGPFLAIDDDCKSFFLSDQPLYQTDPETGLTDKDVERIVAHVNEAMAA